MVDGRKTGGATWKPPKSFCVVKFGMKTHMEDFQWNGRLYMDTLRFFKKMDTEDVLRHDRSEGFQHHFLGKERR